MPSLSPVNKKVADLLKREGLLSAEQCEAALKFANDENMRVEEAVQELGMLPETQLLPALANFYKTRFVSTEKLSKASVDRPTLAMIPKHVAEALAIFPVTFDGKTNTLGVVTADPDDVQMLHHVQSVSGAKTVTAFVARPRAVKSAILRGYGGDLRAFGWYDMEVQAKLHGMHDILGRQERVVTPPEPARAEPERAAPPPLPAGPVEAPRRPALTSIAPPPPAERVAVYSPDEVLELLNVLISLLENTRADLRGHSSHVARLIRRTAERMALPTKSIAAFAAAGYVHDLGKMGTFHLTALNCAEYDGHKVGAQKAFRTPARLLEEVKISPETTEAVVHMYERFDGKGFPDGLAGKEIPFGARVLALVDTYADLTQNPRNPYRKTLNPAEACEVLTKFKRSVFDPDLVDLFHNVVMGEDLKARLLADRYVALLIDPDAEETTVLELRMIEQGFEVRIARTAEQAKKLLAEGKIDIVVSELDLLPGDGLQLLADARQQPWGKEMPWVMHTRRQGRAEAQRAFELGVVDFVSKPTATELLVAKLKARLDTGRATRPTNLGGVSGSLREMGLPDMVQVLFHGRKTGSLKIRHANDAGEIHFLEGAVVNALWGGKKGADAFYLMLKLTDGDFQLDPSFKPQERIIHESAEALLLEGMRRLDEGLAG